MIADYSDNRLEQPCLAHIHNENLLNPGFAPDTEPGTGHILTATAPLLHYPTAPLAPPEIPASDSGPPQMKPISNSASTSHYSTQESPSAFNPSQSSTAWQIPTSQFSRLLALADAMPLDGEVTPVQIWHRVVGADWFWSVDSCALERLQEDLVKAIECYGFGGVILEEVFLGVVQSWLSELGS